MIAFVRAVWWFIGSWLKSCNWLQAENLALRHQLKVVRRRSPGKLQLRNSDRLLFVLLYWLWPGVLSSITIIKPATVVRWHRRGFKTFWRWKSRARPGQPRIPPEVRTLIRQVSLANPLWGAPRELLKVGIDVAQSTVAKYMVQGRRPTSQSWKTFLRNHAGDTALVDFIIVPTATFRLLFGFVVLRHKRCRLIHIAVTSSMTAD